MAAEIQTSVPKPEYEKAIKDPYVMEFLQIKPDAHVYESDIEQALIDHLQQFLLELGHGFSFVSRQKRFTLDGQDFFIDLVFYNYILKCFVLFDLKTDKLTHQDLGQMQMYVNYYARELMNEGDNPPIGVVLCAEKNDAVVKYTLPEGNNQIFASKYFTYLPTEEELKRELRINEFRKLSGEYRERPPGASIAALLNKRISCKQGGETPPTDVVVLLNKALETFADTQK